MKRASVWKLVSIAEAIELLERDGIIVTEDQAEQIMGTITEIVVEQYLESENISLNPQNEMAKIKYTASRA